MKNGLYGVTLSCFTEAGKADELRFEKMLTLMAEKPLAGFVVNGSTGEFPYMGFQEAVVFLRISREQVRDREMVAGICGPTERDVLRLARHAYGIGYTDMILCPPYYYPQKDSEILDFYRTVLSGLPNDVNLILYNIPFCAPRVSLPVVETLAEEDKRVQGIKDSSGDALNFAALCAISARLGRDFSVFTGQDSMLLGALAAGAAGLMSTGSWLLSGIHEKIVSAFARSEWEEARRLQNLVTSVILSLDKVSFPENYRILAQVMGYDAGPFQRKFAFLDDEDALVAYEKQLYRMISGV
ncbi:MAG: dihydrodipicolinate synthase family protein [Sphaerochaeta sp.]|jgi:dihydrodipicolinate synthase/N-acetylneuraminate lyase|uniref:dihydrodipicolinate synthase family protein n=1 Tax=Sphaerochaeta sp. TaxID=1972642 RepID=UPI003D10BF43